MRGERPGAVTAAAILNIIIGVLGILCGLCGLGANLFASALTSGAAPGNPGGNPVADMMRSVEQQVPGYQVVEIGKQSLVLILAILVLIAGIGLLNLKGWARGLTIVYAVVTIFLHLGYAAYEIGLVMPAVEAWQKDFVRRQGGVAAPPMSNFGATGAGVIFGAFLYVAHAVAVLIILLLPGVSAAFAGAGPRRGRYDDEDEDVDDELSEPGRGSRRRRDEDDDDDEDDGRVRRRDRDY